VTSTVKIQVNVPAGNLVRLIPTPTPALTLFMQWLGASAIISMLPACVRSRGASDRWPA
jgi:hypothetical protein